MKKIITIVCLLSFSVFGYSQNFVLYDTILNDVSNTTMNINIEVSTSNITEILVKNTAASTDTFKVFRTVINIDALDQTQFCWGGLCYGSTTNTSNLSLACPQNDTIDFIGNGFHAVFVAGTECVTRQVHYRFYNIHNLADSVGITLQYNCVTGINEVAAVGGSVSDAYPNPVASSSLINYKLDAKAQKAKFVFYDVLGKVVKQITVADKEGSEKINHNDFEAGIYFYSFVVDDKIIATKKLVVSPK